jgi:uncharacterized HhH-GPD family protein
MPLLQLSQNPEADRLISREPLALIIGMVLDQQIPIERAFSAPLDLKKRLGGRLDPAEIAAADPEKLAALFAEPPALHRFPRANAKRVQDLCRLVVEEYGGRPERIWKGARDGAELLARLRRLPGFGQQKAQIFVALCAKQLGVRPPGWEQAAGSFGESGTRLSVADITGPESLAEVREHKRLAKAAARAASSR